MVSPVITIRTAAATAKINIHKLRGNVSVLEGSGGNITVLTGRDGKVLVDAGISRPQGGDSVAVLSGERVRYLINSHWHFDHTEEKEWLHWVGAKTPAHENTRKLLAVTPGVEDWNFTFPPVPDGALPTKLIAT